MVMRIVYDLKLDYLTSVWALEIEFVAPIPEQISTTTTHFSKIWGGAYLKFSPKCGDENLICASGHLREMHCICSGMGATNFKFNP